MPGCVYVAIVIALMCFVFFTKRVDDSFYGFFVGLVVFCDSIVVFSKAVIPMITEETEYCVSSACKTEEIAEGEFLRTEYNDKEYYVFRVDGRTTRCSEEELIVLTSDEVDSPVFFTMHMEPDIAAWFCGKEYKTRDLLVIPEAYTDVVAGRLEGSKYYNEISGWIE